MSFSIVTAPATAERAPGKAASLPGRGVCAMASRAAQEALVDRVHVHVHRIGLEQAGGDVVTPQRRHLRHRLVGYDRDDALLRGFAAMGAPIGREHFVLRTDDQLAYGRLVAAGAGIGFVAAYNLRWLPGVVPVLPMLKIPPLPCWLAVHREIRGSALVRRAFDFLAEAIPRELAAMQATLAQTSTAPASLRHPEQHGSHSIRQ